MPNLMVSVLQLAKFSYWHNSEGPSVSNFNTLKKLKLQLNFSKLWDLGGIRNWMKWNYKNLLFLNFLYLLSISLPLHFLNSSSLPNLFIFTVFYEFPIPMKNHWVEKRREMNGNRPSSRELNEPGKSKYTDTQCSISQTKSYLWEYSYPHKHYQSRASILIK